MTTKKKQSPKSNLKSAKYPKVKITKTKIPAPKKKIDFPSIEKEAISRADRTLSTIETFLARWDATKQKPQYMNQEVIRIKQFYTSLIAWQKSTLKVQKSKFDEASCKKRLASFVHICQNYS